MPPFLDRLTRIVEISIAVSVILVCTFTLLPVFYSSFGIISTVSNSVWMFMVPHIFTIRCMTITSWSHCIALSKQFPYQFVRECSESGVDFNTCVDIARHVPFNFLKYIDINDLNLDPFEVLRLFPV
jgi:hypothetical protein